MNQTQGTAQKPYDSHTRYYEQYLVCQTQGTNRTLILTHKGRGKTLILRHKVYRGKHISINTKIRIYVLFSFWEEWNFLRTGLLAWFGVVSNCYTKVWRSHIRGYVPCC